MGLFSSLFGDRTPTPKPSLLPSKPAPIERTPISGDGYFLAWEHENQAFQVFSKFRVQYGQIPGIQAELRDRVKEAIADLDSRPDGRNLTRHAVYSCNTGEDKADLENATCFNFGVWKNLSVNWNSVRLERGSRQEENGYEHYWRYALVPRPSAFAYWKPIMEDSIKVSLQKKGRLWLSDAKSVWYEVKRSLQEHPCFSDGQDWLGGSSYGLNVTIDCALSRHPIAVKPIIDGILAALHWQESSSNDQVSLRMADALASETLATTPGEVSRMLIATNGAVLGRHSAIILWGKTIQVSPRDDLCSAIEVFAEWTEQAYSSLEFRVFKVAPLSAR